MSEEKRTFELGPTDCCIILREDCSVETRFPHLDEEAQVPNTVLLATAAACCMTNLEMSQQMIAFMLAAIDQLDLATDSPEILESTPK